MWIRIVFDRIERGRRRACLCSLLAISCSFGAIGQTISGVVKDSQGGAIAAAVVSLTARDNNVDARSITDPSGRYQFENAIPGDYLLEASAPGFESSGAHAVSVTKSG